MDATTSRPNFDSPVGLCSVCRYARVVNHPRGGVDYRMCQRSETDPQYEKFPRLPVHNCPGFEEKGA